MSGKDIQVDNGYIRFAHAIPELLAKTEMTGRQARILWALFRLTYGYHKKEDAISLAQFCEATKMKKCHVIDTLRELVDRHIIKRTGGGAGRGHIAIYGFNKYYEQWDKPIEDTEKVPQEVPINGPEKVPQTANKRYPKPPIKGTPITHARENKDSKDKQQLASLPDPTFAAFVAAWHRFVGRPVKSEYEAEWIKDWCDRVTVEGWRAALEKTAKKNPASFVGYLETILNDYAANGYHVESATVASSTVNFSMGDIS